MIIGIDRLLPEHLAVRARAYVASAQVPVAPRDAATVALLRDSEGGRGVEVYVLRRVTTMAFASGMHVFPGGTVDPRDLAAGVSWVGPEPAGWAGRLQVDDVRARGLVLAAVRETFEESGVLLAGPKDDQDGARDRAVVPDTSGPTWEADRVALLDRSSSFAAMLQRRRLAVRADLLRAWARWVTPEFEPRRYDTAFFVAAVPIGQSTRDVGGEADRVAWVRPAELLASLADRSVHMLPPTAAVLAQLADHETVDAVLQVAGDRVISPILPRPVLDAGPARVVLPGEPGYDR